MSVPAIGVIEITEDNVPEKVVTDEAPATAVLEELAVDAVVLVIDGVRDRADEALGANVMTPVIEGDVETEGLEVSEFVSSELTD